MTNIPIGSGPNINIPTIGQAADAKLDAMQFRAQDKSSTTAELLRGKIGQLRMVASERTAQGHQPNFRELKSPNALTLQLIERLR